MARTMREAEPVTACRPRSFWHGARLPHLFTSRRRENGGPWTVICSWCAKPKDLP